MRGHQRRRLGHGVASLRPAEESVSGGKERSGGEGPPAIRTGPLALAAGGGGQSWDWRGCGRPQGWSRPTTAPSPVPCAE